ncbi:DNA-binding transcriptional regulator, XRE-family HTH domain [Cohnella sp. OV330]|uniref:helix-turn-helix transcriptional regulator n=1 Tax=Cohnella sp. OV330 TaxID=1855288 RepID=UPI0008F25031|nr:helix-turn-helix transcriptional regulator [Cohnella sp. OV330]SFA91295.1 DNA-binding transcriptional regulator, XRE-family HTH domain [Cohnella sp. OV330]
MVKNRLKSIRHEYEMNQVEFAKMLGISQSQYNRYELQQRQPLLEIVLQMAEKLNRPVEQIVYLDRHQNPQTGID